MSRLRGTALAAGYLGLTLPSMLVQALLLKSGSRLQASFPMYYHRAVTRMLGIRVHVEGAPPKAGPVLIAANHVSWLDIPVMSTVMPLSFVAKSDVAAWPFFGWLAKLQRSVFIDRTRRVRAMHQKAEIEKRLSAGDVLVLFAEGTSSDGNRVLPFRSALLSAAGADGQDGGPPVYPVSIAYTHRWGLPMGVQGRPEYAWYGDMELLPHLWNVFKRGPIDVTVCFHPPETVGSAGGRKALAELCRQRVRGGLAEALTGRRAAPAERAAGA